MNGAIIEVKNPCTVDPMVVTPPTITIEMNPAMSAYSIAVAPSGAAANRLTTDRAALE
jgi:hypothetical protein